MRFNTAYALSLKISPFQRFFNELSLYLRTWNSKAVGFAAGVYAAALNNRIYIIAYIF